MVNGSAIPAGGATSPVAIAVYETITSSTGVKINGRKNQGFITSGMPNTIGSLMLNNAPGAALDFGYALLAHLRGERASEDVREGMCYRV